MPEFPSRIEADPSVAEANRHIINTIPPDSEDFEDARRGLIALPEIPAIPARRSGDRIVWNFAEYDFLSQNESAEAPPTVNASLWRQGQLTSQAGLFEVTAYATTLRNGVLVFVPGKDRFAGTPQTVIKLTREVLNGLMYGAQGVYRTAFDNAVRDGLVEIPEGKQEYASTVFGYLTQPDPSFPIVAPAASS
jgi:alkyl sulfatase BDS1-like metallo-beta-lactamase superfamily hydrolase